MADSLAQRYAKSVEYLARAEAVIPLGSQTFSKSRTQYPVGAAPLFAARSQGSHTWDIDGNEYVDLVCSLGAVALGYGDEEINEAVDPPAARWRDAVPGASHRGGGRRAPGRPRSLRRAGAVRQERYGCHVGRDAAGAGLHRSRARRGVRVPRLAGLVHRLHEHAPGCARPHAIADPRDPLQRRRGARGRHRGVPRTRSPR